MTSRHVRRAVRWLVDKQNGDGGWGETCESYADPGLAGEGPSTASQTAWALLALLAADGGGGTRRDVPDRASGGGRSVGGAALHGHRLPRRLLHQVPPVPELLATDGAGAVSGRAGHERRGGALAPPR